MLTKKHVLIVEGHEGWRNTLREAMPTDEFEIQLAHNYDEAITALRGQSFELAVVDPVLEGPAWPGPEMSDGNDGLRLLTRLISGYPHTHLIILSGTVGREMLRSSLELPPELPVIQRQEWDRGRFLQTVSHLLADDMIEDMVDDKRDTLLITGDDADKSTDAHRWGPPEPLIEGHDGQIISTGSPGASADDQAGVKTAPLPLHERYQGLTGPLTPTGFTGPLHTGLVPPPVGSRRRKPRILIVEGDVAWQHRLAELMESKQFFWRVAGDLEQAVERLRLESFHVVITDLKLEPPETILEQSKGWHLLELIMRHSPRPKVFVSSRDATRVEVARLFLTYPVKGFLDKERYNEDELMSALHVQLSGPSLRIQTLGDFRVWRDNMPVTHFGDEYAERLIKILITGRGEDMSVEALIEALWPGKSLEMHIGLLGTTISHARRALEPDLPRPNDSHFIMRNGAHYYFNFQGNVEIDSESLRNIVNEGRQYQRHGNIEAALQDYQAAREIYQGDYLPAERTEAWAIQERTTLQSVYADSLNRSADLYAAAGRLNDAIESANLALQVDAYSESTYRRLMRYHACKGQRHAALNAYRTLEKLFSEFMGQAPSLLAQDLYAQIEANQPVDCFEAQTGDAEPTQPK